MTLGFDYGTVSANQTAVRENPLLWIPGVNAGLSVFVEGTGTLASATMALYENGTDVSGSKLTDSVSISGRVIKTKTLTSLVGGSIYKWYLYFTDEGVPTVREGTIYCVKLGVRPSNIPGLIDTLRLAESPLIVYPGQSYPAQVVMDGQGTISTTSMAAYRVNGGDESSTVLSGSYSSTNRVLTLKSIGSLSGGGEWIVYLFFTDAGQSTVRYFEVLAPKLGV